MKKLNEDLKKLIEEHRSGILNFEDTITEFEFLINQYSKKSRRDTEIDKIEEVKDAFYMILQKLYSINNNSLEIQSLREQNIILKKKLGLVV